MFTALLLVLHKHPIVVLVGLVLLSFSFLQLLNTIVVAPLFLYGSDSILLFLAGAHLHQLIQLLQYPDSGNPRRVVLSSSPAADARASNFILTKQFRAISIIYNIYEIIN